MKKTRVILPAIMAIAAMGATAAPLNPEQALSRALSDAPHRALGKSSQFRLAYTCKEAGTDAAFVYARNDNAGFIVASADDSTTALLGYGDTKISDENGNFSPEFIYWLETISKRIHSVAMRSEAPKYEPAPRPYRAPISKMCSTAWGQTWPYYNLCPWIKGARCVTGCAATSMSQVMKFHNWPPTGEGTNSYNWQGHTLTMNFANQTFDWDNMLDTYNSTNSDETQQDAVAKLMKAVGYGINMDYSPSGSGATAPSMGYAFAYYFRYDKSFRQLKRDWFSLYDWEDIVYSSLEQGYPVVYNGIAAEGGHSFVCDGYARNGYFHINWGWNGMSDGFFLLDILDPEQHGTGGAESGFNYNQEIFSFLKPDTGDGSEPYYQLAQSGRLALTCKDNVLTMNSTLYNPGPLTIPSGAFGLTITPVDRVNMPLGEEDYYGYTFGLSEEDGDGPLPALYGWRDVDFDISDLEIGRYLVKPFFIGPDDNLREVMAERSVVREYILNVTSRGATVRPVQPVVPDLRDLNFAASFSSETPITVSGTIINTVNAESNPAIKAIVLSEDLESTLATTDARSYPLGADAFDLFEFEMPVQDCSLLVSGTEYPVALVISDDAGGSLMLCDPVYMLYTGDSGVRTVGEEPTDERREYFNMLGVKVAEAAAGEPTPELPGGIYIVRSASASLKILK